MMCGHGVADGSQGDDDESVLTLLDDSCNTDHLIITDTDNKVGRQSALHHGDSGVTALQSGVGHCILYQNKIKQT